MRFDTTLGTYDDVFSPAAKEVQEIAKAIYDYVISFDKDVCVVPRKGEKSVSFGVGVKKMSESYCYIMPQKDYVNLGFPHGSELIDEDLLLEGSGKKYRHIKICSRGQAQSRNVRDMIERSYRNRSEALKNRKF